MTIYRKLIALAFLILFSIGAQAQSNGSNSSYSRFGLGTLNDQSAAYNRGMGGIGMGLRTGGRVNMANPASYSALDSLSFIFDVGMNASFGHMKSGANSVNVNNCSLNNVNAGLRLHRGLGLSFGFVPYSTIGYNFTNKSPVATEFPSNQEITTESTYYGNGGLHQMYVGLGWRVFKELSIGANVSYIWGSYNHSMAQTFEQGGSSSNEFSKLNMVYDAPIKTYGLEFGVQYPIQLTKEDWLTVGATTSLGHQIKTDATVTRYTSTRDTVQATAINAFDLPYTFGVGATWRHKDKLLLGADAKYEKWADCNVPQTNTATGTLTYTPQTGSYKNRTKIAVGAQYTPNPMGKFLQRTQYRVGANYSTPYLKVNGQDGSSEYGITAGVGLPINNRSMVNVNLQWLRRAPSAKNLITENYFMLNIGITFNEMWFMKFKIH